jgi:hypothetical protein
MGGETYLDVAAAAGSIDKNGYHFQRKGDVRIRFSSTESSVCANAYEKERRAVCKFAFKFGFCCGSKVRDEFLENDVPNVLVSAVPRGQVPFQQPA